MGDTYYIELDCSYCGKKNTEDNSAFGLPDGLMFHEDDEENSFVCKKCGKKNLIEHIFVARPGHIKRSDKK